MKTFLLLIVTIFGVTTSNSQVVEYRIFETAILDSIGELNRAIWLPTKLLTTFDTVDNRIKIFSKEEAEFDIIDKPISKDVFNGYWSYYTAIDKKGTKCEIKLFTIEMAYQSHVATLIIPVETVGSTKLVAYRLRLNEPLKHEERLPLKLTFNSTTLSVWDSKEDKWGKPFPFFAYNTVITLGKDSSISISTQSNSAKYGKGKLTTDRYKWETKKEKTYEGGGHTNYNLKLTKNSEFFIFNIYRNEDGTIKGVAFINDKAMMTYMNTEMGYQVSIPPTERDSLQKFIDNKCQYRIDGKGEAKGIVMQLNIPCVWDSLQENRPNLLRSFSYKVKDENYLAAMLMVIKSDYTPTQKEIDNTPAEEFFKAPSWGKFISSRKVTIDALKWTEAYTYLSVPLSQGETYQHMLSYLLIYKNYVIVLTYKTMSFSEEASQSLFNEYERLFKTLAAGTILYNHWK